MLENYWNSSGDYTDIIYDKSNEGIAKITINRPEVRNAFRPLTVREMIHALNEAREDTNTGAIILTGAGELLRPIGREQERVPGISTQLPVRPGGS